jgi:hypothetical protein
MASGDTIITWVIITIIALVFGFIALLLSSPMTELIGGLTNNTGIDDNNSVQFVDETSSSITPILDNFAFWFMVACFAGLLIMGLYFKWHPVILILGFIFMIIIIFQMAQYANLYDELKTSGELSESGNHTLSNIVFGKQLPVIAGVIIALILAYVFSKRGGGTSDI